MKVGRGTKITVLVMVAAVAGGLVWWRGRAQAEKSGSSALAPAHVVRRDFRASVLATGAVRPKVGAEVKVGARITGKLDRLHANVGDMVERGQVIGELQKADLEATVAQRSAEAAVSAARISDAEARLRLAELELQRQQQLIAQDFTSQQAVDNAVRDREVAAASLLLAERQRDAAIAAQREAEVKLSYATIVAPIAGVVGSVSTQEGETVAAGLNAPTFVTVIDLRRLQVDAYVDEVDIGKVRSGQKAVFTVDAFPGREFAGEVAAIYPKAVIQDNVVNYDVVIEISTPFGGLLRPDMTASVTITLDERKGVLAVPAAAVVRERGKTLVRVVRGDRSEAREITVGWKDGGWVEVVRGLTEGETVLLEASGNDKEAIR